MPPFLFNQGNYQPPQPEALPRTAVEDLLRFQTVQRGQTPVGPTAPITPQEMVDLYSQSEQAAQAAQPQQEQYANIPPLDPDSADEISAAPVLMGPLINRDPRVAPERRAFNPQMTDAPVVTGEQGAAIDREQSDLYGEMGPHTADPNTTSRAQVSSSPNGLVVDWPGVLQAPTTLPPIQTEEDAANFQSWLQRGIANHSANAPVSLDPNNPSFDAGMATQLLLSQQPQFRSGAQGPAGSLVEQQFRTRMDGPVTPSNALAMGLANEEVDAAQAQADAAERGVQAQQTQGLGQYANAQDDMAVQAAIEQQERQAEMRSRMTAYDRTIQRVASNQVDPNRFFGGFAGRMGAAIAVALGSIGSAMGGGENAALAIIQSAIDRDINAQMSNMQNQQNAAQMEGSALRQFQSILGDEAAAQEASRAAYITGVLARVDAQIAGATGERLASLQRLRNALAQQQQAAAAVAADRARMSIETAVTMRQRMPTTPQAQYMQNAAGVVAQDLEQNMPQEPGMFDQVNQEMGPADMEFSAEEAAQEPQWQEPADMTFSVNEVPEPTRRRSPTGAGRRRPVVQQRTEQETNRVQRRAGINRTPITQESWAAIVESAREQLGENAEQLLGSRPPALPAGISVNDWATMARSFGTAESANRVRQHMSDAVNFDDIMSRMVALRTREGGILIDPEGSAAELQALTANAEAIWRRLMGFGVLNSQGEREDLQRVFPDPSTITAANAAGMYDRILAQMRSTYDRGMSTIARDLESHGLAPNSAAARNRRAAQQRLLRLVDAARRNEVKTELGAAREQGRLREPEAQ